MANWGTCGNRARKKRRRQVYREARAFHEARVIRLQVIGRLDKLKDSGYDRRLRSWRKRQPKDFMDRAIRRMAPATRRQIAGTLRGLT